MLEYGLGMRVRVEGMRVCVGIFKSYTNQPNEVSPPATHASFSIQLYPNELGCGLRVGVES